MHRILTSLAVVFMTALWAVSCGGGTGTKDTGAPQTVATPAGGTFNAAQNIGLACYDGTGSGCDSTYYTLDGSDPTTASSVYAGPITITEDTVLKFFSEDLAGNIEIVRTESYIIRIAPVDSTPPATTATPVGGTYAAAQSVVLACDDGTGSGCDTTYYSLDGTDPTTASSVYAGAIPIADDTTLKFFSEDLAGNAESAQTEVYIVDTSPPTTIALPIGDTYDTAQDIALACDDGTGSGCASIFYTLDGSDPTTASSVYASPIAIAVDTTLKFFSEDLAGNAEGIQTETYIIDTAPPTSSAAPPGGLYNAALEVALACDDGAGSGCDATFYTIDGTDPTAASSVYTDPIAVSTDMTLKFFSVDLVGHAENLQIESYIIDFSSPVSSASPSGGSYNDVQNIVLTCDDGAGSGCAGIYYTLDGSDPTTASPFYIDPIPITIDTSLRFFAADLAGNAEAIQTEDYVIVVANWEPLGPYGGSVRDVAFDPDTPATVYAATRGGMFKTVDEGMHWAAINHGLTTLNAMVAAVDPFDSNRIFIGTSGGGAFRSIDGGITWEHLDEITDAYVELFAFDSTTQGVVYAGGANDVFKSDDSGDTWAAQATGSVNGQFKSVAVVGDTVYVGTWADGIFRTRNAGADWEPANNGLVGESMQGLAADPLDANLVYVATRVNGVQKTTDGGDSWSPANAGLPNTIESLALIPTDPDTVYAGTNLEGMYKTIDGGVTWAPVGNGLAAEVSVNAIALEPGNPATIFAATTGHGLYKSSDTAANWSQSNHGIHALEITDMAFDPTDTDILWVATNGTGVFKSTDAGENWVEMNTGLASLYLGSLAIDPADPDTAFVGSGRGVYKTTDGGLTWNGTFGLPWASTYDLIIDPSTSDVLYAGLGNTPGVYKSVDGGDNWSDASTGISGTFVRALAVDHTDTDILYATGVPCDGIYKSLNGGASWTALDTGLANDCRWSMVMDPNDPDTLYTGSRGVYRTTDGGGSWLLVDTGLPQWSVINALSIVPDSSRIYAGESIEGVFVSDDSGATWTEFSESLGSKSINKLLVDPTAPALIYAGTQAGSVWVYR